ncbi:restriction endonuclease [Streptomyces virginiae]|uniref:nSTAND3 domain-containing NTPase n=1 Tax=Streptomyces virginiae TaxID=1961 RepID=UPI0036672B23
METFDLSRLTDFDFEAVCKDLFEEEFGVRLEIFTAGADGGVDLRYLNGDDPALIIQCKHWRRSTRAKLVDHIKNSELPKIVDLHPGRYVLATSVELTRAAKDKLYEVLRPFVTSPGDIYGRDELDALLRKHDRVVRNHLRLWLTSASVLNSLLAKSVVTRSHDLMQRVAETLRVYAECGSRAEAIEMLEEKHVCVVAGAPGIGKTTLSHVLCAHYLSQGYDLVEISEDADEANSLWDDSVPQLFYYDDFLGQTALDEKLGKNEDGRLISLMSRVAGSPNKRFLLTTREYILAQAKQRYERIDRHRFDLQTCVLDIASYTYEARASILYNHVYCSKLPETLKAPFAARDVYQPIIVHDNFNPRVIVATLTDVQLVGSDPSRIGQEVVENLDDPGRVWEHIVSHQLKPADVHLLRTILSFLGAVSLRDLERVWLSSGMSSRELKKSLAVLDGTMLRTSNAGKYVFVEFHNPSVRDYMRDYLSADSVEVDCFLRDIHVFEQIESLWSMISSRTGSELIASLKRSKLALESRALDVFDSRGVLVKGRYASRDSAHRSVVYMKLGELLDSEAIRVKGWSEICDGDAIHNSAEPGSVIEILNHLAKSDRAELRDFLGSAVDQAVDWIMGDLSDWSLLTAAAEFMQDVSEICPIDDAMSAVEAEMEEYAGTAIEDWAESSRRDPHTPLEEMERILQYYEDLIGWRWNGPTEETFALARQYVEEATPKYDSPNISSGSSASPRGTLREMRGVAAMMATLSNSNPECGGE